MWPSYLRLRTYGLDVAEMFFFLRTYGVYAEWRGSRTLNKLKVIVTVKLSAIPITIPPPPHHAHVKPKKNIFSLRAHIHLHLCTRQPNRGTIALFFFQKFSFWFYVLVRYRYGLGDDYQSSAKSLTYAKTKSRSPPTYTCSYYLDRKRKQPSMYTLFLFIVFCVH